MTNYRHHYLRVGSALIAASLLAMTASSVTAATKKKTTKKKVTATTKAAATTAATTATTTAAATTATTKAAGGTSTYGKQADGTYLGKGGFKLDLSKCPKDYDVNQGITDKEIRLFSSTTKSG